MINTNMQNNPPTVQIRPNTPYPGFRPPQPEVQFNRVENIYDRTAINNIVESSLKNGFNDVKGGAVSEIKDETIKVFSEFSMGLILLVLVICIIVSTTYAFIIYIRNRKKEQIQTKTESHMLDPEVEKILREYADK